MAARVMCTSLTYLVEFQTVHLTRAIEQKSNVFDPTPPPRPSLKKKVNTVEGVNFVSILTIQKSTSLASLSPRTVWVVVPLLLYILLWTRQLRNKSPAKVSNERVIANWTICSKRSKFCRLLTMYAHWNHSLYIADRSCSRTLTKLWRRVMTIVSCMSAYLCINLSCATLLIYGS